MNLRPRSIRRITPSTDVHVSRSTFDRFRAALPLALAAACVLAQGPVRAQGDTVPEAPVSHRALNLGANGVGISIGNSREWTGLRLNLVDRQVRQVNGVNLTVWKPGRNPEFEMNGVAVGLFAPGAHRINGVALGGLGVVATDQINGVAASGIVTLARQRLRGVGLGGIATVGDHGIDGIAGASFVVLSEGDVNGITGSGVLSIVEGRHTGISMGLFAAYTDGVLTGASLSGGATAVKGESRGLVASGLVVVGRQLNGVQAAGLLVLADSVRGVTVGGLGIQAHHVRGLGAALARVHTSALDGVSVSGWNDVRGTQRGLTIGLFNYARDLHGVQIGLLNYVRNNRKGLRLLPLFNTRFVDGG